MTGRVRAALVAVLLAGCSSEEPKPAPQASPAAARPSAPAPAAPQGGGIVIKGSKTADPNEGKDKEPTPEERDRIARLQASAQGSQGKHESGDPVKFAPTGGEQKQGSKQRVRGSSEWTNSINFAVKRAQDENKLIFCDFTCSDKSPPSYRLKNEVFETASFKDWAAEYVVLVEVDFPQKSALPDPLRMQNQKLAEMFKVEKFPTVVFVDPSGKTYGQLGYKEGGPGLWLLDAQAIVDKYHP